MLCHLLTEGPLSWITAHVCSVLFLLDLHSCTSFSRSHFLMLSVHAALGLPCPHLHVVCPHVSWPSLSTPCCCLSTWLLVFPVHTLMLSVDFLFSFTLFDVVCPCGSWSSLSTPSCCLSTCLLAFPVHTLLLPVHVALGLPCPHLDVVCRRGSWSSLSTP